MNLPLKPGVSTSEFWIVIISGLMLTAQAALSMMNVGWAMAGITVLGLVYTSMRGRLKSIQAQTAADQAKAQIQNPPPPTT